MSTKLISLLVVGLLLGCQANTFQRAENLPPNIVIIFTDDQGYQDVGCFGSPDIKTPHLDQMAKEGGRFSNFYVAQPVCSASRAALLTGCYSNRVGVHGAYFPGVGKGLHPQETTLAEMLKPLGYKTAAFGKWHLGDDPSMMPNAQGFDEFWGIPFSNDMWPLHPSQDYFNFTPLPLIEQNDTIAFLEDQSQLTRQITEKAVSFIERNKEAPFFLYVPHPQPHVPLFVSDSMKGKSAAGMYGDVIAEIDWSVGNILNSLKTNGLDEHTLVIFTSDNGPWLSYGNHSGRALPLREGKGTALEGGVRVPCIMRWLGQIPAGLDSDVPCMTIDLMPTIAHYTGAALPDRKIDGLNIASIIEGTETEKSPHDAYWFYYKNNELHGILSGDGRWKLYLPHTYRSMNGREGGKDGGFEPYDQNEIGQELYDLNSDISETKEVSDQYPEILATLLEQAELARATLGDNLTEREGSENRPTGSIEEGD